MNTTKSYDLTGIQFRFNLTGNGSACASFQNTVTQEKIDCNISNCGSGIGDFSDSILNLIDVRQSADGLHFDEYIDKMLSHNNEERCTVPKTDFLWENDDLEIEFYLEKLNDRIVNLKIYETNYADDTEDLLRFQATISLMEIAGQVLAEMDRLIISYGFQGYYERWDHEFPLNSYLNLKSYVLLSRNEGVLRKVVPNINLPFRLELKLLNKLMAVNTDEAQDQNIRNSR